MRNGEYTLVVAPPEWPGNRYRGRYCYEHHLVWWRHTGELIEEGEVVHHRNGDKRDNRFENLDKIKVGEHNAVHACPPAMVTLRCFWCGEVFERARRDYVSARKQFGQTRFFCCRSHQVKQQQRDRWHGERNGK